MCKLNFIVSGPHFIGIKINITRYSLLKPPKEVPETPLLPTQVKFRK